MSYASPQTAGAQAEIQTLVDAFAATPGAMLPILHAIQDRFGYIPQEAVTIVAESLRQTRADVHGIISFYHHFRTQPSGRHIVQLCRAEACQALGARQLEAHAKKALGIDFHQTTADREITLEPVYCLGNCACGPSLRVGDDIHGRMTPEKFDRLTDHLSATVVEVK